MFAYDLLCPVCGAVMDSIHTSRVGGMGESLIGSDGRRFHGQDSPDCMEDAKWHRGWNRGEITEIPDKEKVMFEVGKEVTMLFHCAGAVSEEEYMICHVRDDIITLDTDSEPDKCYRFNTKTGECINDNTYLGCKRTLKLE